MGMTRRKPALSNIPPFPSNSRTVPNSHYRDYTIEQLMLHPSFVAWSLQSDPENVTFWNVWLAENEDCRPRLEQARLLTIALRERYHAELPEEIFRKNMDTLLRQVELPTLHTRSFRQWLYQHRAVAAALIGVVFLAIGWYLLPSANTTLTAKKWVEKTGIKTVLEKNNSSATLSTVILSDGTIVTLEPGSRLTYPPVFDGRQRKVYLSGEAFFEVAKNPAKPFLVYTGSSVVRVVGTSFRVKASGQSPDQIAVRTGRVLVYTYHDFEKAGSDERALAEKAMVLLPNEQATLDTTQHILQKLPVQNAAEVAAIIAPKELIYDDRPVTEVFQYLANLYGVEISYDQSAMSTCKITTSFRNESLEERVSSICAAIGAQFRLEEGKIVISGRACQ